MALRLRRMFITALALPGLLSLVGGAARAAADCAQVGFLGVRGSGEDPLDAQVKMGTPVHKTYTVLKTLLDEADPPVTMTPHEVDYPAVGVPELFDQIIDSVSFTPPSVQSGITSLRAALDHTCEEKLVLVGYSQGAWVIKQAMLAPDFQAAYGSKIKAVVLFGDPSFDRDDPFAAKNYSNMVEGLMSLMYDKAADLAGVRDALLIKSRLPGWLPYGQSYCHGGDPVCGRAQANRIQACIDVLLNGSNDGNAFCSRTHEDYHAGTADGAAYDLAHLLIPRPFDPEPNPGPRPDINVTKVTETSGDPICAGDSPTVRATVHNSGQAPTGVFPYRWEVDDDIAETSTHTAIPTGGSTLVDFVLPDISQGTHIVKFAADHNREIKESVESNNTATVKLVVKSCGPTGPRPDMAVTSMSILPGEPLCAGNSPTVRAMIKNRGTVETGFFGIRWVDDAGTVFDGGHFSIPAGTADSHDHIWHDITAGVHSVSFTADFDDGIPEVNENNNSRTFTFTVADCGGS
ncbi:hypothetical protein Aph01nite_22510 [Acrocarpospora phusangensis]|uniref:CARDB domain-containing protein n=1 Tax=Acrocarpospora phusangensis TaxID=1070424 RepID=A0A919UJK4_9ACTN|nr:CARDB domain-containing protein [Acrocarpospora phusangensis]GIH23941.1 hypothetical protein Aph01nite_22510 [Acrocarpospora phusangensis]